MELPRHRLHYLTLATHKGRHILFGTKPSASIHYAIKRVKPHVVISGYRLTALELDSLRKLRDKGLDVQGRLDTLVDVEFSDEAKYLAELEKRLDKATIDKHKEVLLQAARQSESQHWYDWQMLSLPNEPEDPSVVERERADGTDGLVRSVHDSHKDSAFAGVQVVSDGEHLHVFRQSVSGTLLVDRFVLDNAMNRLNRALEVRFKRSRQRFAPKRTASGADAIDSRDFRDSDGKFFYAPTVELRLIQHLVHGRFAVVVVPTLEFERARWHIFAWDSSDKRARVTTLLAAEGGGYDLRDHTIVEGTAARAKFRQIPGVMHRVLDIRGPSDQVLEPSAPPSATVYYLQREIEGDDGKKQMIRGGRRVLFAAPTDDGMIAALSFAVHPDGTLAKLSESGVNKLRAEQNESLLLSADVLERTETRAGATVEQPPKVTRRGLRFDGDTSKGRATSRGSLALASSSFTVEFWARRGSSAHSAMVIGQGSIAAGKGLHIGFRESGVFTFGFYGDDLNTSKKYIDREWHHWACAYDKVSKKRRIYRDGALVGEDTSSGQYSGNGPILIGLIVWGEYFTGDVADVRVWKCPRSEAEIRDNRDKRLTGRELDLVALWPLDAVAKGRARNLVRRAADLEIKNAYPATRMLRRLLNDKTPATNYQNSTLFAVVERSTYCESIEFRGDVSALEFLFWGVSLDGTTTAKIPVKAVITELANGWKRASARFTVPAKLTHLRSFDMRGLGSDWAKIDVRNHRIERLQATITESTYTDKVKLEQLIPDHATRGRERSSLARLERDETALRGQIAALDTTLARSPDQRNAAIKSRKNAILQLEKTAVDRAKERSRRGRYLSYRGTLAIRGNNGKNDKFLSVSGHNVNANRNSVGPWETFFLQNAESESSEALVRYGDTIGLRTHTGKYLIADNPTWPQSHYYWLNAVNPKLGPYERFQILNPDDLSDTSLVLRGGPIALRSLRTTHGVKIMLTGTEGWYQKMWCEHEDVKQSSRFIAVHRGDSPAVTRAYVAYDQAQGRLEADRLALANMERLARDAATDRSLVQAERDRVARELKLLQTKIATMATSLLAATGKDLATPLKMTALTPAKSVFTVTGALLGFARTSVRPQAVESMEGAVRLHFPDTDGRLRACTLDAVSERWQADDLGACVRFAGNGGIKIPFQQRYSSTAFTIELWLRWNGRGPDVEFLTGRADEELEVHLGGEGLAGRLRFIPVPGYFIDTDANAIVPGQWTHIACVYGGTLNSGLIYINGVAVVRRRTLHKKSRASTSSPLTLGRRTSGLFPLNGQMQEVRLWNVALTGDEIRAQMQFPRSGHEPGLVGYWPLNDASGDTVRDHTPAGNHGKLEGPRFYPAKTPLGRIPTSALEFGPGGSVTGLGGIDVANKSFTVELWARCKGVTGAVEGLVYQGTHGLNVCLHLVFMPGNKFSFRFYGNNLDVSTATDTSWHHWACVYDHANKRRSVYCDGIKVAEDRPSAPYQGMGEVVLGDYVSVGSLRFNGHLADVRVWTRARSRAEIRRDMNRRLRGDEAALIGYWRLDQVESGKIRNGRGELVGTVHKAAATPAPDLPMMPADSLLAGEFDSLEGGETKVALLRRFHTWSMPHSIGLAMGQRVDVLEMRWLGNAQMNPTLLGYIEGPPPVPSENLTVNDDYAGASGVEFKVTESTTTTFKTSMATGLDSKLTVEVGGGSNTGAGVAVIANAFEVLEMRYALQGKLDLSARFLWETESSGTVTSTTSEQLNLKGMREAKARNAAVGRRYEPKNVGYATVVSTLADVFALRLRSSKRMVSYRTTPVADVPPDINTVTFLINPAYTLNGSLDGQIGSQAADSRFYGHVPRERMQFGSAVEASYFRLREAYELRDAIERSNRNLEAGAINLRSDLLDRARIQSSGDSGDANATKNKEQQKKETQDKSRRALAGVKSQKGASRKPAANSIEKVIAQTPKGNIVNSYVWDGDGGLRGQTQSFASSWQHVFGGSLSADVGIGVKAAIDGWGLHFLFDLMVSLHFTETLTNTTANQRAIELNISLGVENRDITDNRDRALHPGEKVDRYRFMSFALQPSTHHFNEFFDRVVDPEWLSSDDEEALTLRQIDRSKPNQTWRVLHRVTYVERPK